MSFAQFQHRFGHGRSVEVYKYIVERRVDLSSSVIAICPYLDIMSSNTEAFAVEEQEPEVYELLQKINCNLFF